MARLRTAGSGRVIHPAVELAERLIECGKLVDVFHTTLSFIHEKFGLDSGIFLLTGSGDDRALISHLEYRGGKLQPVRGARIVVGKEGDAVAYTFREAEEGRPKFEYFPSISSDERSNHGFLLYDKAGFAPLMYKGKPIGVLWVDKRGEEIHPSIQRRLGEIQGIVGMSIQRAEAERQIAEAESVRGAMIKINNWFRDHVGNSMVTLHGWADKLCAGEPEAIIQDEIRKLDRRLRLFDMAMSFATGTAKCEMTSIKPSELLTTIAEPRRHEVEGGDKDKKLKFTLRIQENLPVIQGDRRMLAAAVDELLTNAIKFTKEGEIQLNASQTPQGEVKIEVTNTGLPIDRADLPSLFLLFPKMSNHRHIPQECIGLYVVNQVANAHGGIADCESLRTPNYSGPNKFSVTLPPKRD